MTEPRVLVLGYGNPGRRDDGLGTEAAEALGVPPMPGVDVRAALQLTIEDAADAADYDLVVFIDAARSGPAPFAVHGVAAAGEVGFTSHLVSPELVLSLCERVYGRAPRASLVAIRGYAFGLGEGLSVRACANLSAALAYVRDQLRTPARTFTKPS